MRSGASRRASTRCSTRCRARCGALDASVHAQRQLVADASHELRTPVTSLRTNIEVLKQPRDGAGRPRAAARRRRRADRGAHTADERPDRARARRATAPAEREDVRLDIVVRGDRARPPPLAADPRSRSSSSPVVLSGAPARLARAVNNLIDNAVNYSAAGQPGGDRSARTAS